MPLTPTKRNRRYKHSKGHWKQAEARLSSSSSGGDEAGPLLGAALSRYQSLLADRLRFVFDLRDGVDITDLADIPDCSFDRRLPSGQVLQALTSPSFLEGEMGDALVEYQVCKYLREDRSKTSYGAWSPKPRDPAEVRPGAATYSVDDDFTYEEFAQDVDKLISRKATVDEESILEPEEVQERELKEALYRIKALLLLKGKAVDDAALATKFPPSIIVDNYYFLNFHKPGAFGWYFDPELCQIASLTDYQRLVILNYCGYQYQEWSRYRSHYNTPETDREYLLYWKTITQKIKWVEDHMYPDTSSLEWFDIERKAYYQAIRIAADFENIHFELACLGIEEFLWSTRLHVNNLKDLDSVFFEIWKRVIKEKEKDCFAKALKEVYDLKMFPSCERSMKRGEDMAEKFKRCTVGITAEVPEPKARQLIAQQVREKLALTWGYEHYASKKLQVAEYIGLIGKASA